MENPFTKLPQKKIQQIPSLKIQAQDVGCIYAIV